MANLQSQCAEGRNIFDTLFSFVNSKPSVSQVEQSSPDSDSNEQTNDRLHGMPSALSDVDSVPDTPRLIADSPEELPKCPDVEKFNKISPLFSPPRALCTNVWISPPRTHPPEEEEQGAYSKSFYSPDDLSEALTSLLPSSSEVGSTIRRRCTHLRYPPTLAAAMQQVKPNSDEIVVTLNNIKMAPSARSKDSGFLEIDASHFSCTSLADRLSSPPGITSTPTVWDLTTGPKRHPRPQPLKLQQNHGEAKSLKKIGAHSRKCAQGPSSTVMYVDMTDSPSNWSAGQFIDGTLDDNSPRTTSDPLPAAPRPLMKAHNIVAPSSFHQHQTSSSPAAVPSSAFNPSPLSMPFIAPWPVTKSDMSVSSRQTSLTISQKCIRGKVFMTELCRLLVGEGLSNVDAILPLVLTSDLLSPFEPPFGIPFPVFSGKYAKSSSMLLVGDALRLIVLANEQSEAEILRLSAFVLNFCICNSFGVSLKHLCVKTTDGICQVSLSNIFSQEPLNTIRAIPYPYELFPLMLTAQKFAQLRGPSWTLCCSPAEICRCVIRVISGKTKLSHLVISTRMKDDLDQYLTGNPTESSLSMRKIIQANLTRFAPTDLTNIVKRLFTDHAQCTAGIGLICLLFRRLFVHLFANHPTIAAVLLIGEKGMAEAGGYLLEHLRSVHKATADSLRRLRESYASLVSAGACLSARHRLVADCSTNSQLDAGRARLFDSSKDARADLLRIFNLKIYPSLVNLTDRISSARVYLTSIRDTDLLMFQSGDTQLKNNACNLISTGLATLNTLSQQNLPSNMRDLVHTCKAQLRLLKPPGLLTDLEKLLAQLTDIKNGLIVTRSWMEAFVTEGVVDCVADGQIKLFINHLQSQLDVVEVWSRLTHDVVLQPVSARMVSVLLDILSKDDRRFISRIDEISRLKHTRLNIPYGSKNVEGTSFYGVETELLKNTPSVEVEGKPIVGVAFSAASTIINVDSLGDGLVDEKEKTSLIKLGNSKLLTQVDWLSTGQLANTVDNVANKPKLIKIVDFQSPEVNADEFVYDQSKSTNGKNKKKKISIKTTDSNHLEGNSVLLSTDQPAAITDDDEEKSRKRISIRVGDREPAESDTRSLLLAEPRRKPRQLDRRLVGRLMRRRKIRRGKGKQDTAGENGIPINLKLRLLKERALKRLVSLAQTTAVCKS